jgi:adenylosuccinate lyase
MQVKMHGEDNDLLDRIISDPAFNLSESDLSELLNPEAYIGRSSEQVDEFIETMVKPIREKNATVLGKEVDLKV